jgi:Zn-dependent protease/CBS domain-containing protein
MIFRLGKIKGIQIGVHFSWIPVFLLFTWGAVAFFREFLPGLSEAGYWGTSALATILLFFGVFWHEICHALVALRKGVPVKSITLYIFGGVAEMESEFTRPSDELWIAAAGPVASLLLAGLCFGIAWISRSLPYPTVLFSYLGNINLLLALFNLIPAFPLDGGRILRALLWQWKKDLRQATRIAAKAGVFISYLLFLLGFVSIVLWGDLFGGLWWIVLGWFLQGAAGSGYQQLVVKQALENWPVRAIMSQEIPSVPPNLTLEELANQFFTGKGQAAFLVSLWGDPQGLVTLSDLSKVSRQEWPREVVRTVMTPLDRLVTVGPEDSAYNALAKMSTANIGRLPVLEDGKIIGLVSRQDLLDSLRVRAQMMGTRDNGPNQSSSHRQ